MRILLTAISLALLSCVPGIAQVSLFEESIPAKDVPQQVKLLQQQERHYLSTRYARQQLVLGKQDYLIRLRDDLQVISRFKFMHRYPAGSYAYEGIIDGPLAGHVVLSAYADRVAGMITFDDGRRFLIDQPADGVFAISQSSESAFAAQEQHNDFIDPPTPVGKNVSTLANADVCNVNNTCPAPSTIDLMIVYTQQAENLWGGQANTIANITTAVTNMTTSMTNSGISNVSFRLVHAAKVNYTESGSTSTDLSRLAGTSDTYMDEIHGWRDTYGADMVSLIVGSPTNTCGVGYLNTSATNYSAGNGFNVSVYNCVVGNYTMAHEFGHNMGLRHDYFVDGGTTPCAHHHGYVNQKAIQLGTASASSQRWRTIMAYNDHCSSVGISCTRLNRWSNPLLTYNGDSTGRPIGATQPADEAYAFYRMACVVAGFRPVGSGCATPTSLNTTNISTTNATLNWTAASGAVSYDVEYKTSAETNWTAAATGTTATSVNLSSLNAATTYNWRVRTNCSGGTTSSFATASFATDALCATPGGLSSTNITSNSATLTWGAVSGASSYTIEIKTSVATTWSVLAAGYTNTSILATGLVSGATYNWRVNATCPAGTGAFATASFATQVVACTDAWEPNESRTAARSITTGTAIQGLISSSSDNDYFKFSNSTAAPNIRITLTNLPANYNIELYRTGVNKRVAVSANSGTTSETITLNNAAIGQYEVRVYGNSRNEFNTINCYTLQANVSNIAYDQADNDKAEWGPAAGGITVYPQPATGVLNIAFDAVASGKTEVALVNQLGMNLQQKNMTASKGTNFTTLDVSLTPTGIYVLKITQNGVVKTARVLVQKR